MATQPLISQWFQKRRALAMGLGSAGVGAGGLIFSFTTRVALANHGIRFAYVTNGIIVFLVLTPTTIFFKREPNTFTLNLLYSNISISPHARTQCQVQVYTLRNAQESRPRIHLSLVILCYVRLHDPATVNRHLHDTGCRSKVCTLIPE